MDIASLTVSTGRGARYRIALTAWVLFLAIPFTTAALADDSSVKKGTAAAIAEPTPAPDKPAPDKPAPDKPAPDKPAPDKPTLKSNQTQDLTEGLLELLQDPQSASVAPKDGLPVPPPVMMPSVDGEDLGTQAQHPLGEVHQEMKVVAGWLRNGESGQQTFGLQRNIVLRLDALIAELENQSSKSAPSQIGTSASGTSSAPDQRSESVNDETDGVEPQSDNSGTPQEIADNGSGDSTDKSQAAPNFGDAQSQSQGPPTPKRGDPSPADSNDPTALQHNAWGTLPDRVRDQMQSRMVERFLPSFRAEIEDYYRALVK